MQFILLQGKVTLTTVTFEIEEILLKQFVS